MSTEPTFTAQHHDSEDDALDPKNTDHAAGTQQAAENADTESPS